MHVKFSTVAAAELDDATLYYEQAVPGLGEQFRGEAERAARHGNWAVCPCYGLKSGRRFGAACCHVSPTL